MNIFLHNSRCSKSRETLQILEKSWKSYVLREYLKNPLDFSDLQDLKEKLWLDVIDFTRTWEEEFIRSSLTKDSSDTEILKFMSSHPKIMQRPILITDRWAIIWRPPEDILKLF